MATGFEAVGDAMTGGIVARAVEPAHGEGSAAAHGQCLNCKTELIGAHCHGCGQKAHIHRTMHEYAHDLLHSVFHFDGKIWRTLPMLAFRPGELTRRYIHGERAKFVSPLALFLFSVFLMFAVVGGLAGPVQAPDEATIQEVQVELKGKPLSELEAEKAKLQQRSDALKAQIATAKAQNADAASLETQRKAVDEEIEQVDFARGLLMGQTLSKINSGKTGWAALDKAVDKARKNPNLLIYKLQSNAYKYSWALIPLSLPFVWLMFAWRRAFKLYDHAVFVTYSITFMLFLVVGLTVLGALGAPDEMTGFGALLIPPLHMYKQMRGAYRVRRAAGLIRTAALVFVAAVVLLVFLALLLALGLLG
jgi:Protein of unknown function (DUF3667)